MSPLILSLSSMLLFTRMSYIPALGHCGVWWLTLVEAGSNYCVEIIVVVVIDMVVVDCSLYIAGGEKINGNWLGWWFSVGLREVN